MTHKDVVNALKEACKANPAANAVFHMLATRKRARSTLTLFSLQRRMKKEGFDYTREQYAQVLELLAKLGLGELDKDFKNRIRGLKKIKAKLQSVGSAACSNSEVISSIKQRNVYAPLDLPSVQLKPKVILRKAPPQGATFKDPKETTNRPVSVSTTINGKIVTIQIPADLESKDVAELISMVRGPIA